MPIGKNYERKNNMKKIYFALLLIPQLCLAAVSFDYWVEILPPFGKVLINKSQICPAPLQHSAKCLVKNQLVSSTMVIEGLGAHVCYLTILRQGAVRIEQAQSVFCTIETRPASQSAPGSIKLQKHF